MSWTHCVDNECQIHLSEKQGSGCYLQFTRTSREPSVPHDHDWRQEMKANPGEDWAPQQPRQRRARRLITKSQAGRIVSTTSATTTEGRRWTPATTPDKWQKEEHCQRITEGNTRREQPWGHGCGERGAKKTIPEIKALEKSKLDLRSQLDRAVQFIVTKDTNLKKLHKEKEKLQQA